MSKNIWRDIASYTPFLIYPHIVTLFISWVLDGGLTEDNDYEQPQYVQPQPVKKKVREKCKFCDGLGYVRNTNSNLQTDIVYRFCNICKGKGIVTYIKEQP